MKTNIIKANLSKTNLSKAWVSALFILFSLNACAAELMDQSRLHKLLSEQAEEISIEGNIVQLTFDGISMLCVSDANADRMRIITPIARVEDVLPEMLLVAMAANFHSALDARYAIGDGTVYAAFIHPLSPLTSEQLSSALRQVASASKTFGTDYTSGELSFPGGSRAPQQNKPTPSRL